MKLPKMVIVNAIPILDYKFTSGFTSGTLMIESGLSSESCQIGKAKEKTSICFQFTRGRQFEN